MHYFYNSIRLNTKFNINKQIQVPVNGSGRVSSNYIRHLCVQSRTYRPTTTLPLLALVPLIYTLHTTIHIHKLLQFRTKTHQYLHTLPFLYIFAVGKNLKPYKRVVSLFYTYI